MLYRVIGKYRIADKRGSPSRRRHRHHHRRHQRVGGRVDYRLFKTKTINSFGKHENLIFTYWILLDVYQLLMRQRCKQLTRHTEQRVSLHTKYKMKFMS